VAVEVKPMPNLSHKSSSQIGRRRAISGESSPDVLSSRTSEDGLNRSIEGSIAQASVMWLLHRRLEAVQDLDESLDQQIVQFSSTVFDAIGTGYPMLRNAGQERLWLIYFKGLLAAKTHPREVMLRALRNIASSTGFGGLPPLSKGPGATAKPTPGRTSDDDVEVLKQIACGLEQDR
jgi:hypothetical protein